MLREYAITEDGWLADAERSESPNQDERPAGCVPELIVLHSISLPPGQFGGPHIAELFCNRLDWNAHSYFKSIEGMRVSAHVLVRRDGALLQFVSFARRAWHAGESTFRGRTRCNDFSIGIEMEGEDDTAYSDAQYARVAALVSALCRHYPQLDYRKTAGHCDISPGRKTDPGAAFDWLRLYDELAVT